MNILGIETSCDDTAAAVIQDGRIIRSNIVASQDEMHEKYGGIIPEISSREHFLNFLPVVYEALEIAGLTYRQLDGIAVTKGPGLAGALLVGVNSAKGLAMSWDKPLIGINHLEGHIYSAWLENNDLSDTHGFPMVCLIASGGHTDLVLMKDHLVYETIGRTVDDAAGEAFDKAARILGLAFPGGPEIQRMSINAEGMTEKLPRPSVKESLNFSFSGLKSALARRAESEGFYSNGVTSDPTEAQVREYSAEFQEAIVDCLVKNTRAAVKEFNATAVVLGGGVAANSRLREKMDSDMPVPVIVPIPKLCTDNGAMIGAAAYFRFRDGFFQEWDMDAIPNLKL